jgi:glycosyltransferase involved in cell wall biosynthesis
LKKITYILANIDKAIAFEWIVEHIDKNKYDLSFILLNAQKPFLYDWLRKKNIQVVWLPHYGKQLYPKNWLKITSILKKIKPDAVHCHLFDANLLGLSAAKFLGIKKRIYTRHHSTFHHQYYPQAVKYDKLCNLLATDIVAISENVREVLTDKENVNKNKIHLIHHGFDLEKFTHPNKKQVDFLKRKYNINKEDYPVIGVIARYIKLKGHQYLIRAFKNVLTHYPNAKLVLANANGPDKEYVQNLLKTNLPQNTYIEIPFEHDLFSLYHLFNVYIHVPVNSHIEAFGQTYVESLAAGIPSIFTLSGVAKEFVKNRFNALVVPYQNSEAITNGVLEILKNKQLNQTLTENGKQSVKPFNISIFLDKLEQLYNL